MNILNTWNALNRLPWGRDLFSLFLGFRIPYTGSIGARILELSDGFAKVELRDRRKVRNHLDSIHAVALMNLGEITSGLALHSGLPKNARAILIKYQIEYVKKARGRLVAEARCTAPASNENREFEVSSVIKNEAGEVVAEARALWKIGPAR